MKKRIIGIDIARAFAIIGMILVNFKVVFGDHGPQWLKSIASVVDGKAAATFVVLAGVGIALIFKSSFETGNAPLLQQTRKGIIKKAIFLFVLGISYIGIWPADILHFYGIYMLVVLLLLFQSQATLLISSIALMLLYPVLMVLFNYEIGWDFQRLEYTDFWQPQGFLRNLLYNGFHPVIPWAAFMLIGYWFGRFDLYNIAFIKKSFRISLVLFVLLQLISSGLLWYLSDGLSFTEKSDLEVVFGTSPMPPLPMYMLSGSSFAICIITACILLAKKYVNSAFLRALQHTGQLALSFYVAHVIIGMGAIEVLWPERMGKFSLVFSIFYALFFSVICILFAMYWRKRYKKGPLEWLMRKLTG